MTIDHLRQECMVPSPLSRKRGSSPSAVSENLVLSRNPERKRERTREIGKPTFSFSKSRFEQLPLLILS